MPKTAAYIANIAATGKIVANAIQNILFLAGHGQYAVAVDNLETIRRDNAITAQRGDQPRFCLFLTNGLEKANVVVPREVWLGDGHPKACAICAIHLDVKVTLVVEVAVAIYSRCFRTPFTLVECRHIRRMSRSREQRERGGSE